MKYVKLTGWGNSKTHLIPLKAITDFSEENQYTSVRLYSGTVINVQESFSMVEEILDLDGAEVYDADDVEEVNVDYENMSKLYTDED